MELTQKGIDNLKSIGFLGTDVNLEISLFEHLFVYRETETPDEIQCIVYYPHMDTDILFSHGYYSKSDIIECFESQKESILSFTDMTEQDWLELPIQQMFSDCMGVNWFDFSYVSLTVTDLETFTKPTVKYTNIGYFQGDEAEQFLKGLNRVGPEKVLKYMENTGYDNGEYNDELTDESLCKELNCFTHETDQYCLCWNSAYGWVSLERKLTKEEYSLFN